MTNGSLQEFPSVITFTTQAFEEGKFYCINSELSLEVLHSLILVCQ